MQEPADRDPDPQKGESSRPKTGEELAQLAKDIMNGLVFTDRHLKHPDDFQYVFMVFSLAPPEIIDDLRQNPPGLIYQYLNRASPMGVNGHPCFFSASMLTQTEAFKVFSMLEVLEAAQEEAKKLFDAKVNPALAAIGAISPEDELSPTTEQPI